MSDCTIIFIFEDYCRDIILITNYQIIECQQSAKLSTQIIPF